MPLTLQTFAARIRETLQHGNDPAGREQAAAILRDALQDRAFVQSLFDDRSPERKVVYQDPQLGFCILAHRYTDARQGGPHDHGPSWAIYGQADGETVMSDWQRVDGAAAGERSSKSDCTKARSCRASRRMAAACSRPAGSLPCCSVSRMRAAKVWSVRGMAFPV